MQPGQEQRMDAEHVTCDEAIQIADEAVDRCADGYDAKLLTISALVEGLHAQLFGIASLNDPAASHEAIADNGVIHEAIHALVRELPSLKHTRPTADLGEDGGLVERLRDGDDLSARMQAADRLILYREALVAARPYVEANASRDSRMTAHHKGADVLDMIDAVLSRSGG